MASGRIASFTRRACTSVAALSAASRSVSAAVGVASALIPT